MTIRSFSRSIFAVSLALFVAFALDACAKKDSSKSASAPVAKVNNRTITQDDVESALNQMPPQARSVYETPEAKKEIVDRLITRQLVIEAAENEGLDKDPTIVNRVRALREGLLLEAYLRNAVEQKTKVTDEEVKAYYDSTPEARRTPDEVKAKHILVKTEAEAQNIEKELKAGKKFEELAQQYSQDPGSKVRGGDLGSIHRGQTVAEFDKALFALKPGETSGIIKTPFGYHIIRVESRTEGKPQPFDQAKEMLRQQLLREKQKKGFDDLVAGLKKKAQIKIF